MVFVERTRRILAEMSLCVDMLIKQSLESLRCGENIQKINDCEKSDGSESLDCVRVMLDEID